MLTSEQIRAARAMLRMEQKELAERADVSLPSIKRLEGMEGEITSVRVVTLNAIKSALEAAGVTFIDAGAASAAGGAGVRLTAPQAEE